MTIAFDTPKRKTVSHVRNFVLGDSVRFCFTRGWTNDASKELLLLLGSNWPHDIGTEGHETFLVFRCPCFQIVGILCDLWLKVLAPLDEVPLVQRFLFDWLWGKLIPIGWRNTQHLTNYMDNVPYLVILCNCFIVLVV